VQEELMNQYCFYYTHAYWIYFATLCQTGYSTDKFGLWLFC